MQNRGWVKLWREQFTHPISERKPWCDGCAWAFLYSQANYKRGIANFRNQYVPIERGQFVTSISKLSKIFGWTRKRTKAFLISLQNEEMITLKSGTNWDQKGTPSGYTRRDSRFSILTIRNYEEFQTIEEIDGAAEVEAEGIAEAQQERTIKEVKKKRNLFVEDSEPLRLAQFLLQEILLQHIHRNYYK